MIREISKKDTSVSIAKAIAIILMVLAHTRFSVYGNVLINMFHMPLFFFFSGYCFKDKYLISVKQFLKKRIKGIYFPYLKWSLFFLLVHNVFFAIGIYNENIGWQNRFPLKYEWSDFFYHFFSIVTKMQGHDHLLGGFWFLFTLLICSILGFGCIRLFKNPFVGIVVLLFCAVIFSFVNIRIPYFDIGSREFIATAIFVSGYALNKIDFKKVNPFFYVLFTLFVILGSFVWPMSLLNVQTWKILVWFLSALAGTIVVFRIALFLNECKIERFLIFIGDNTMPILVWHFLCFKLVSFFIIKLNDLPISYLAHFPTIEEYSRTGWWLAYLIVGVFVPLLYPLGGRVRNCK